MTIAARAVALYEAGDDEQLWQLAEEQWPAIGAPLDPAIAELCYFARAASARAERWAAADVWGARAMVAAVLTGSAETAARLLMPQFFTLMRSGHFEESRKVLEEMARLVDVSGAPHGGALARLYHEKMASSYLMEGLYAEAAASYNRAVEVSGTDARGRVKSLAGAALAMYLTDPDDGAAVALRARLESVKAEASMQSFPDVEADAEHNLRWLDGDEDAWRPFEIL